MQRRQFRQHSRTDRASTAHQPVTFYSGGSAIKMPELQRLIEQAKAEADALVTITRADGTTFTGRRNYGCADNGTVQVYVIPVEQRTRAMRAHYRATFYKNVAGQWERITREEAEQL